MTPGGVFLVLVGVVVVFVVVTTLIAARRGGRSPGDPPASHLCLDPAGFPVLPAPRGVRQPRPSRAARRNSGRSSGRSLLRAPRRAAAP
jgi:hypothetical protein